MPEVLIAARSVYARKDVLRPVVNGNNVPSAGKAVTVSVQGDLHDIGESLVKMMLQGAGFETIDLETEVKPDCSVAAVQEHQPQLLGTSASLATNTPAMRVTTEALVDAELRDKVKIIVGRVLLAAPFADRIGADAYAADAAGAVYVARDCVARRWGAGRGCPRSVEGSS